MASTLGRSGGRALDAIILYLLIKEGWIQQVYFNCIAIYCNHFRREDIFSKDPLKRA